MNIYTIVFVLISLNHSFLILTSNYFNYNGTIDFQFRPMESFLQDRLKELELKNNANDIPPVITNKNEIVNQGDGLDLFIDKSQEQIESISDSIKKKLLKRGIIGVPGIFVLYNGLATMSDKNGKAFLPKLHDDKKLTVIITLEIIPLIKTKKHVPYKLISSTEYKSAWYELEFVENEDEISGEWEIHSVPSQKNIPDNAIIIVGDPQKLHFDESSKMPVSQNIILPDILYTLEAPVAQLYSSYALPVLQYFKPIGYKLRESEEGKQIHFMKGIITGDTIIVSDNPFDDSNEEKGKGNESGSINIPTGYSTALM